MTDIVQSAPQFNVLATSREKLNMTGETVFTLLGLHVPDWATPADALTYDAIQLFVQSAQRARPDFELQAEDLDYLARICRLSAGLPLALVLAAGWVDVLSLEQIVTELQQGIDILETELRDVPERQRSVRASFNYSWAHLDERERAVFIKLSVFRGGFTPEAAQAVSGANPRHLRKLVDKALVQRVAAGRYDIHELLRQYAEEKLIADGELAAIEAAHTHYFAEFVQQRAADIKGRRQRDGMNEFGADFQNVRTAWQRAISAKQYAALDAMMEGLWMGCMMRERLRDSEVPFETAVHTLEAEHDDTACLTLTRLRLWWIRVVKDTFRHDADDMRGQLKRCKAIAQQHGDSMALAHCLIPQAFIALFQGQFEEALDHVGQVILMETRINRQRLLDDAHAIQGFVAVIQGKYEAGLQLASQVVSSAAKGRGFNHMAWRTLTLATFCLGDREHALRHAETGLQGLIENCNNRDAAQWLPIAALLVAEEGNEECAAELIGLLDNHPDSISGWLEQWPLWSQFRQDLEDALSPDRFAAAWERGTAFDLRTVVEALPVTFAEWVP